MIAIQKFTVEPRIPERLLPLKDLAYNLWWTWNPNAIDLFRRIDPDLWEEAGHNPVIMLRSIKQESFERVLKENVFLSHMDNVCAELKRYLEKASWYEKVHGGQLGARIAYFSAEFGLHESCPIYSGGLGILSGDYLKSASDLGLPVVGVGLLYSKGYFRQQLNWDGWQQEKYPDYDFCNMAFTLERRPDGTPTQVSIKLPNRKFYAQIWRAQVGRVPLFLLDTNIEANDPADREITSRLYGGDLHMRIRQEILLGIGGIRALDLLGLSPTVCHMNEGHSAFLALERLRHLMRQKNLSFTEAKEAITASTIFTTHTPVPAGNDTFPPELIRAYLFEYCDMLKLPMDEFLGLGRVNPSNPQEPFSMTVLALKLASRSNGVSQLHGSVTRRIWGKIWPALPEGDVPITHVTNGIHTQTWLSDEISRLFDRYLGLKWRKDPVNRSIWKRIDTIPDAELWRSHERLRERLVAFSRQRLKLSLRSRGARQSILRCADEVLDPKALTIGFARRFSSYKRADLILKNAERLARILSHPERPVQIIFAGKAHPNDNPGKEMVRKVVHFANREEFRRKIVFLEDYDMEIARILVQGVDLWLNNPRRPLEASGTSGIKSGVNGGINLSILDGWWCEGYKGNNGWVLGNGEEYEDQGYQDEVESLALYDLLEKEVVPLFYKRGPDNLPREWISMMKASLRTLCPQFNTDRMVEEYTEKLYVPCLLQWNRLAAQNFKGTVKLSQWKVRVQKHWNEVKVVHVQAVPCGPLTTGSKLPVKAWIHTGNLRPRDLSVSLVHGPLDSGGNFLSREATLMTHHGGNSHKGHLFTGTLSCGSGGRYGFSLRVLPHHSGLNHPFELGFVTWWEGQTKEPVFPGEGEELAQVSK